MIQHKISIQSSQFQYTESKGYFNICGKKLITISIPSFYCVTVTFKRTKINAFEAKKVSLVRRCKTACRGTERIWFIRTGLMASLQTNGTCRYSYYQCLATRGLSITLLLQHPIRCLRGMTPVTMSPKPGHCYEPPRICSNAEQESEPPWV